MERIDEYNKISAEIEGIKKEITKRKVKLKKEILEQFNILKKFGYHYQHLYFSHRYEIKYKTINWESEPSLYNTEITIITYNDEPIVRMKKRIEFSNVKSLVFLKEVEDFVNQTLMNEFKKGVEEQIKKEFNNINEKLEKLKNG